MEWKNFSMQKLLGISESMTGWKLNKIECNYIVFVNSTDLSRAIRANKNKKKDSTRLMSTVKSSDSTNKSKYQISVEFKLRNQAIFIRNLNSILICCAGLFFYYVKRRRLFHLQSESCQATCYVKAYHTLWFHSSTTARLHQIIMTSIPFAWLQHLLLAIVADMQFSLLSI